MRGVVARRRVAFFGSAYDSRTAPTAPLPGFLFPLREKLGSWVGVDPADFAMALINEYPPGAPIGWHRDAPQYEIVTGVSLLTPCRLKLGPTCRRRRRPERDVPEKRRTRSNCSRGRVLDQRRSQAQLRAQHSAGRRVAVFAHVSDLATVNTTMARGFESKDVEFQQAERERGRTAAAHSARRSACSKRNARIWNWPLSKARAEQKAATHPNHRRMLDEAIRALEEEIRAIT